MTRDDDYEDTRFTCSFDKEQANIGKHQVSFFQARNAFDDPNHVILPDHKHSEQESRFFCFGEVNNSVMTVRFTFRNQRIRIIGAGYWREGRKVYQEKQDG